MQPKSPSPDYDFILKDNQAQKRRLPMPNLTKPVLIGVGVIVGLIIIAIIGMVLSGKNKGKYQPYESVMARGAETLRVTKLVQQLQLQDSQTQALAATVNSAMSSDQQQYTSYLAKNGVKVSATLLAADTDKSTDNSLQTASQGNSLDSAYETYLKTALAKYQDDLQSAFVTSGPAGKVLISNSIESTRALLNTAPIK
jgi:hypothetical protein